MVQEKIFSVILFQWSRDIYIWWWKLIHALSAHRADKNSFTVKYVCKCLLFFFFFFFFLLFNLHHYCPVWMFSMGNLRCFPRKSQQWQSCATLPAVHVGCFGISIIHWTLWATGSLSCAQMLMHALAHRGAQTPYKSLHWRWTLWKKSLATLGNRTCISSVMVRCTTSWAASPPTLILSLVLYRECKWI